MYAAGDGPEAPGVDARDGSTSDGGHRRAPDCGAEERSGPTTAPARPSDWVRSVTPADWSRLVDYVRRQLHLPIQDSEDLVQQALHDISSGGLDPEEPIHAAEMPRWTAAILRFRSLHAHRYQRRFDDLRSDRPAPNAADPFATAELVELREYLIHALDQLPADQRDAVLLHDVEGWSYAEIAEFAGATPAAIRQRRTRGCNPRLSSCRRCRVRR